MPLATADLNENNILLVSADPVLPPAFAEAVAAAAATAAAPSVPALTLSTGTQMLSSHGSGGHAGSGVLSTSGTLEQLTAGPGARVLERHEEAQRQAQAQPAGAAASPHDSAAAATTTASAAAARVPAPDGLSGGGGDRGFSRSGSLLTPIWDGSSRGTSHAIGAAAGGHAEGAATAQSTAGAAAASASTGTGGAAAAPAGSSGAAGSTSRLLLRRGSALLPTIGSVASGRSTGSSTGGGGGGGGSSHLVAQYRRVSELLRHVFKISDFGLSVRLEDPGQTHVSDMAQVRAWRGRCEAACCYILLRRGAAAGVHCMHADVHPTNRPTNHPPPRTTRRPPTDTRRARPTTPVRP